MKRSLITIILIGTICSSCNKEINIASISNHFYQTYNERKDYEKYISFYSNDIVLEDIVNGDRIKGKKNLKAFFDWGNSNYQNSNLNNLVVLEKIIEGKKAVIKGYFSKFQWGQTKVEAMHFITILTFDANGKITHQIDWINYPNYLVNYSKRKNSNHWIKHYSKIQE